MLFRDGYWAIVIRLARQYRLFFKVMRDGWRRGLPLQSRAAPRIVRSIRSFPKRSEQVARSDDKSKAEHPGPNGRKGVQRLEMVEVVVITAMHPAASHKELIVEGHVVDAQVQRA